MYEIKIKTFKDLKRKENMQLYGDLAEFPNKTEILCYHCCHSFESKPIPMPVSYRKGIFSVQGNYCSWNCLKSANQLSNEISKFTRAALITLMYQKVTKTTDYISMAPPREALKIFGGTMDIEEFRSDSKAVYEIVFPPLCNVSPCVEKNVNFAWVKQEAANKNFEIFQDQDSVSNEPIKLQRQQPLKNSQNTLEATMGIFNHAS